ncbi:hypothetical protein BKA60DRAFT_66084 [Fusarium oxysporum]|nr:hypothetical protein BKA60DRAFT_66084 [Fusarium oxysporum]
MTFWFVFSACLSAISSACSDVAHALSLNDATSKGLPSILPSGYIRLPIQFLLSRGCVACVVDTESLASRCVALRGDTIRISHFPAVVVSISRRTAIQSKLCFKHSQLQPPHFTLQ